MASSEDIALNGERQAAARRLLADPIVTAHTHPEDFTVIRTHSDWLIQRFDRVLGYELTVAAEYARLAKAGLVRSVTQPLTRPSGARFSPRTYSYLALCLAVLVEAPAKLPLPRLVADVREAAAEAGLDLDPEDRMSERRAFEAAVRHLTDLGAVTQHDGAPTAHALDGTGNPWLEVAPEVVRRMVAHPPHSTPDSEEFLAAAEAEDPSGDAAAELALRRLIAETAVLYRDDLSERQRERLGRHQWRAVAELGALLGCDAEIRAEGVALIMPEEADADRVTAFPSSAPVGQAALLLVERLVARLAPEGVAVRAVPVPAELVEAELAAVLDSGADHWHRWARSAFNHAPDPEGLAGRLLGLLEDAGLMRRSSSPEAARYEGWSLLAAAARYGGRPNRARGGAGEQGETP